MLTSATRGETLTPNPNECNSMLISGTRGIYPYLYIAEESVPCAKFISLPSSMFTKPDHAFPHFFMLLRQAVFGEKSHRQFHCESEAGLFVWENSKGNTPIRQCAWRIRNR